MGPDASLIDAIAVTEPRKASLYFDIKRNTLDDGPGIRSVVFFKGCPLSCTWCQNPESINTGYELSFDAEKCIGCKDCGDACPEQAIDFSSPDKIIRDKCTQCFKCVEVCPSGALERCGNDIDMDRLVDKVLEDEAFFEASGGGVTVSGGEALMQMESVGELFARLKEKDVHTLIQTAGLFNYKTFESLVLPYTDTIYYDLKLIDSDAHKQYCGVPNRSIIENFKKVQALALESVIEVLPRVPLVPFITDTDENLNGIADLMHENGVTKMQILPYNPIWLDKLPRFGGVQRLDFGERTGKFMPDVEIERCTAIFESRGIHVHCH